MATKSKTKAYDRLTLKQRRLLGELDQIASLLRLDYAQIKEYKPEERTFRLELMRRQLVVSEVVVQYTLIDEHLNIQLCDYFFGRSRSYINLWKTKKFRNFNYHVLEALSLMEKLRFVKAITRLPRFVSADIERLNALRNGLAHAFFPENLRTTKPVYKGKGIFTLEGVRMFVDDMAKLVSYFHGINRLRLEADGNG